VEKMITKSGLAIVLAFFFVIASEGQEAKRDVTSDNPLIATYVVMPRYFAAALATRSQGEVIVAVKVSPEGDVTEAKTISGNQILGGNSIYVLRNWKFNASKNKDEIREAEITFSYKLIEKRNKTTEALSVFSLPFRVEVTEVIPEEKPTFTRSVGNKDIKSKTMASH
jgi:TonB family protein